MTNERSKTTRDAAAQTRKDEHPARPEQVDEGFQQGYDQARDTPEERLEPNFARGISKEDPEGQRRGRFSDGHEETGETAEKKVERRFSEGAEQSTTSN